MASDLALLKRWAERREARAFREIMVRYAPMVYATCVRVLRDPTEAEDVAQECFETLVRTPDKPTKHLGAWFHRVATNRCLDRIRSEQRRKVREDAFASQGLVRVEPEWNDVYESVDAAIAELPEELRIPLVAHYLQGQSCRTIAHSLGISGRTVLRRLDKATECLANALKNRGVVVSLAGLVAVLGARAAEAGSIPASLSTALGKLALAQAQAATLSGGSAVSAFLGSVATAKGAGVGLVALCVLAVAGFVAFRQVNEPDSGEVPFAAESARAGESAPPAPDWNAPEPSTALVEAPGGLAPPATARLHVSVLNVNGKGVPGASLQVTADDGTRTETVADAEGAFEVADLAPGRMIELVARAEGYKEARLEVEMPSPGGTKGVSITMEADTRVSGRVVDLEGYPVPNVETQFVPRASSSEGWYRGGSSVSTATDEYGLFHIEGLAPGTYSLRFSTARYTVDALEPIEIAPREHSGDLVLVAPYTLDATIHGYVTDEEGNPIPDVTVSGRTIYGFRRTNLQSKQEASTKTDEQGWYALEGAVDPVDVLFTPPEESGFAKVWTNNVAPGAAEVNATLPEAGALGGIVVAAASGIPIEDFKVQLWSAQDVKGEVYPDRTRVEAEKPGQPGRFAIPGLTPGLVTVLASAREHSSKLLRDIPVFAGGRSTELRVALGEPCVLKAPFTVDGKPNQDHVGLVEVFSTDTPRLVSRFHMYFSEGQPVITASDLPEGTYMVLGTISDEEIEFHFRSSQRTTATLVPGQTTRLNFDFVNRSGICGHVTAPKGSAHCVVVVYDPSSVPTQPCDCLIYGIGEYRITGETGEYMIPYLTPGQYLATAYCSEAGFDFHRAQSFPVTLEEDAVTELDFDLTSDNVTSGLPR